MPGLYSTLLSRVAKTAVGFAIVAERVTDEIGKVRGTLSWVMFR